MEKKRTASTKIKPSEIAEAAGPRRPPRKPPRKPQPASKRTSNNPAQPSKQSNPPKK